MHEHDRTPVPHPAELEPIRIDRDIAALIQALWRIGIETDASCQDVGEGQVWILFTTADDARKFLNVVAGIRDREGPDAGGGLYGRCTSMEGGWEVEVGVWDDNVIVDESDRITAFTGPPDVVIKTGVRFPIIDYFRVLHLVRNA